MEKYKILIVDDDPDERLIFTDYFTAVCEDFDMEFVSNGMLALSHLESITENWSLPQLIVLDLNMPVLNGVETLKRLKSNDRFKSIPVIIFSNADDDRERKMCAMLGADSFFLKPSTLDEAEKIGMHFFEAIEKK